MYDDVPFTIPPQPTFFCHGVLFCNKHVHYTNVGSKLKGGGGSAAYIYNRNTIQFFIGTEEHYIGM